MALHPLGGGDMNVLKSSLHGISDAGSFHCKRRRDWALCYGLGRTNNQ